MGRRVSLPPPAPARPVEEVQHEYSTLLGPAPKPAHRPGSHRSRIPRPPVTLTCVYAVRGLYPECRAEFNEDPEAYIEFGNHPAGIERYRALLNELIRAEAISPDDAGHLPF